MKFRATLVLLALAIGLGAFMILHTARRLEEHPAPGGGIRIFARDAAPEELLGADGMEIMREGMHLRLSRQNGGPWRATDETHDVPADGELLSRILNSLGTMTALAVVKPPPGGTLDLASYGLIRPGGQVQYLSVGIGPRQWRLYIGAPTVDDKGVYVLCQDRTDDVVHVAPRALLDLALLDPWHFRDKAMLPGLTLAGPGTARKLTIDVAGQPRVACQLSEDWRLVEPVEDAADERRVLRFIAGLGALKFTEENFVGDFEAPSESFGFDIPKARIAVQAGEKDFALIIGNEDPERIGEFFAKSPGESAVFRLDAQVVKAVSLTASDIRSREPLAFSPMAVSGLAIDTRRRQVIRLAREGGEWTMTQPAGQTPDPSLVYSFLAELRGLRIEDWIDDPTNEHVLGLGLAQPTASIILSRAGAPDLRIDFGDEDAEGMLCHARVNQRGPVLLVPTALLRVILTGHGLFLPRRVLDFDPATVASVVVTHEDHSLRIERTESGWQRSPPGRGAIENARAQDLLWTLCHLQSKRLVIENPSDVAALYGLQPPRARIAIHWKRAETPPAVLLIGKAADKGELYVMVPGEDRVHVVAADVLEKALALVEGAESDQPKRE